MRHLAIFNEILAMLTIRKYWPDYSVGYIKSERPDWLNMDDSTGIEVTRSMNKDEGVADSLAREYFGKNLSSIPPKRLRNFKGELFFKDDGPLFALSPNKGLVDTSSFYNQTVQSFHEKINKLKSYKALKRNILYIFHSFDLNLREIESLLDDFSLKEEKRFNIIFLDNIDSLITYNIDELTLKKVGKLKENIQLIGQAEEMVNYYQSNNQIKDFEKWISICSNGESRTQTKVMKH